MISCQWAWRAPLTKPHLPLTVMPPSAGAASAEGLSVPQMRTSGGGEDLVLDGVGEETGHEGRDPVHRRGPGGGAVTAAELGGDLDEGAGVGLVAAVPLGHAQLEDAGLGERLDGLVLETPLLLGLRGVLPQQRHEVGRAPYQLRTRGNLGGEHRKSSRGRNSRRARPF
ncbi:hypothetical protein GCM10020254_86370 [Streptomyces goshikiensis]